MRAEIAGMCICSPKLIQSPAELLLPALLCPPLTYPWPSVQLPAQTEALSADTLLKEQQSECGS